MVADTPAPIVWEPSTREHYCVDSYQPIRDIPGNRCERHEGDPKACYTSVRDPLCKHEPSKVWSSVVYPNCVECKDCGRIGTVADVPSTP